MYNYYRSQNETITPKEWLIEAAVLMVSVALALFFQPILRDSLLKDLTRYERALPITTQEQFEYAQETHVGDVLGYGTLSPTLPVTMPELTVPYAVVNRVHEHYTMHVYYTESCTGSGDSRVCTTEMHTYWSWDYTFSESKSTDGYQFLGVKFPASHINISPVWHLQGNLIQPSYKPTADGYVYQGSDDRYYFDVVPMQVNGTIYVNFAEQAYNPANHNRPLDFYVNQTPEQIVAARKHMMNVWMVLYFIAFITILSGVYLVLAYEVLDIE